MQQVFGNTYRPDSKRQFPRLLLLNQKNNAEPRGNKGRQENLLIMEQTFESILATLLEQQDRESEQEMETPLQDFELSKESQEFLEKTEQYFDDFAEKAANLEAAKEKGTSTKKWMLETLDKILEGKSEEAKKNVIDTISSAQTKIILSHEETINSIVESPNNE